MSGQQILLAAAAATVAEARPAGTGTYWDVKVIIPVPVQMYRIGVKAVDYFHPRRGGT